MGKLIKIALTGGPCAGKSRALTYLTESLKKDGIKVYPITECATALINSGKTPEKMGVRPFHSLLFSTQLNAENEVIREAGQHNGDAVMITDRGLLDNRAYVTEEDFLSYARPLGFTENQLRNRYDAVFHMVTAANGASAYYQLANNRARSETPDRACELDEALLALWTGTAHLRVLDNATDFTGKLTRLKNEVYAVLGIPKPLEIERKFLIEMPDIAFLNKMRLCRRVPITQAYLTTNDEGRFRVRKRGIGDDAIYIKTVKHKINDIKRIEIETTITKEAFNAYLSDRKHIQGIISKDRYCLVWQSAYFELDVFPFWQDKALLEIELLSETQPYALPDFVKLIREVSHERTYRNKALAQIYGTGYSN